MLRRVALDRDDLVTPGKGLAAKRFDRGLDLRKVLLEVGVDVPHHDLGDVVRGRFGFRAKSLDGDGAKSNAGKQSQRDGVLRFHDVSFCLVEQICTQAGFSVQSE
jgi:hypothetical protein